ncbi:MAG: hypothetical protein AB2A00_05280 [Myxococcota bacterium]
MILFDLTYELTLGVVAAALASRRPHARQTIFTDGLLVSSLIYIPTCMAAFAAWPAWQTMYFVDVTNPAHALWAAATSGSGLAACYVLGFLLARRLVSTRGMRALYAFLAVLWPCILSFIFVLTWERAFTVTTYADFHSSRTFEIRWGTPDSLLGGPLTTFLVVGGVINALAVAILVLRTRPRAP